ncbi:unnamed protein product, partial [Symbiodinium necroappetens]
MPMAYGSEARNALPVLFSGFVSPNFGALVHLTPEGRATRDPGDTGIERSSATRRRGHVEQGNKNSYH